LKTVVQDPYNKLVRAYFVNPMHAGQLQGAYSHTVSAWADSGDGTVVQLEAGIDGDIVQELRFRALACPHLISAAELFCIRFEGKPVTSLQEFSPADIQQELQVPVNKTGRILLLEDAVRRLGQNAVAFLKY
jgi:NifU-like protein involved in Fe-S cluster formation